MPYVDKHYRIYTDRARTAIAGLSMGGSQSLNVGIAHLDRFAYIGVFSAGPRTVDETFQKTGSGCFSHLQPKVVTVDGQKTFG